MYNEIDPTCIESRTDHIVALDKHDVRKPMRCRRRAYDDQGFRLIIIVIIVIRLKATMISIRSGKLRVNNEDDKMPIVLSKACGRSMQL